MNEGRDAYAIIQMWLQVAYLTSPITAQIVSTQIALSEIIKKLSLNLEKDSAHGIREERKSFG